MVTTWQPVRIGGLLLRLSVAAGGRATDHPKTAHCQQAKQSKAEVLHGVQLRPGLWTVLGERGSRARVQIQGCIIRGFVPTLPESGVGQTGPIHYPATCRTRKPESQTDVEANPDA